jgi:hypothetical protein
MIVLRGMETLDGEVRGIMFQRSGGGKGGGGKRVRAGDGGERRGAGGAGSVVRRQLIHLFDLPLFNE